MSRYKNLGELQDLLLRACPPDSTGKRSIPVLAKHLGVSNQYVYRWIEEKSVPPKYVTKLVEISDEQVSFSDFHKFVF
ncbi:helix-turn-helix domain-containing protein [Pseudomonas stutzeri]|uniref:YdaS family helix-turn-helix protein n=1 Tax=Stutzerimonas stutzeri TaxID=316 RepID=UPI00210BC313|nr:helix-turn-helix domain-containing protein [Stutzerimonas stutzeri]